MHLLLSGEVVSGIQFRNGMDMTPTHYAKRNTSPSSPCCFVGDLFCRMDPRVWPPPSNGLRTRATDYMIFLTTLYYIILLCWSFTLVMVPKMCYLNVNFFKNQWICHHRPLCHGMVSPLPINVGCLASVIITGSPGALPNIMGRASPFQCKMLQLVVWFRHLFLLGLRPFFHWHNFATKKQILNFILIYSHKYRRLIQGFCFILGSWPDLAKSY
jgi:hypothetical protein